MSKAKALSALAHKLGRCVYFMLKNKQVFDEKRKYGISYSYGKLEITSNNSNVRLAV